MANTQNEYDLVRDPIADQVRPDDHKLAASAFVDRAAAFGEFLKTVRRCEQPFGHALRG
jgi:hypothetical protein